LEASELALASREARVKELEAIIAAKEAREKALLEKVRAALLAFEGKGLTVEQRNGRIYVSMEAKLLFASGSTTVGSEGKSALVKLAAVLQDQKDIEILVEGHTDTDKVSSSSHPKDNWELSVLRSTEVVKIMLSNSSIDAKQLTAAGRGEFLPVDPSNKAKNRRIEIILIPNLDELFQVLEGN
jgi:chemotaxis protein MotB